jgi:hypothetical protein
MAVIFKLLPLIILSIGVLYLSIKKTNRNILLGLIGLLILESISYLKIGVREGEGNWTLYFSGPLYLLLMHSLYNQLFFSLFKKVVFKRLYMVVVLTMLIGLFFIYKRNINVVFHYNAVIELIILAYPTVYFLKLMKQKIKYDTKHFMLNSIIFLFFSLEILLYVMLKFILDSNLFKSIMSIAYFRFAIIQLLYISLIYFGCKLGKKQEI